MTGKDIRLCLACNHKVSDHKSLNAKGSRYCTGDYCPCPDVKIDESTT